MPFASALSAYGMIPEGVYDRTSTTQHRMFYGWPGPEYWQTAD
ncbi:hypothetical protein [Mitsuokella sp. AF33-22]|nr:hypothetical protein [Mitsuokella sp. AF33-22]